MAEIIVVDNGSVDNTRNLIQRDFPTVRIIESGINEGFGRANNRGLAEVETPYALLINPDALLQTDSLNALVEAAKRYPSAAILAPQLMDQFGVLEANYKRNAFVRENGPGHAILPEGDVCADYVSGAVWLVNMAHLQKIGFFDPRIFLFYEDDDLCLRARAAGYEIVLVEAACAIHVMGTSSGKDDAPRQFKRQMHMTWARFYLEQKYNGDKAVKLLSRRLRVLYSFKIMLSMLFTRNKLNRYRARLAGIKAFSETPSQAPGLR